MFSTSVSGYLILYTTSSTYASDGEVVVDGNSATSGRLNNLEENIPYSIVVQAIFNSALRINSTKVYLKTWSNGKLQ